VPGGPKGTLAALDKRTGRVIWRSEALKDQAAYTSPMPMEVGGVKQYAILTNPGLAGIAAKDGKLLWKHTRKQAYGTEVVNTPLVDGPFLYTTVDAGNGGCELVKVEKDGDAFKATSVYANKNLMNHHGNVVLFGGHVYGFGQRAGWLCQDFKTGEVVWSEPRKLTPGSMTCADGRFYCYTENDGTVALVEASAEGWKETGRFKIPKQSKQRQPQGRIWTPPVVANGKLYLRDQELLFCFDVKAK
jgi:outer membrane protein assembly factor BamB